MYRIYSANGYAGEDFREYEGTYDSIGKAIVALEEHDPLGQGYIIDCRDHSLMMIVNTCYHDSQMIETMWCLSRDRWIPELRTLVERIEAIDSRKED